MEKEISLSQKVYDSIKSRIIDQTYPAGMALTESLLSEEFGVSKTPVKTAINRLANEGWLQTGFRKKVYVKEFSRQQIDEFYKLRKIIEKAAVEEIFQTGSNWNFSFKLEAALLRMKANIKDFFLLESADAEFHRVLVGVFNSEKIMQVYDNINDELLRVNIIAFKYNETKGTEYATSIIKELEEFILAVREEDFDRAIHYLIDVHMMNGYDQAIAALQETIQAQTD